MMVEIMITLLCNRSLQNLRSTDLIRTLISRSHFGGIKIMAYAMEMKSIQLTDSIQGLVLEIV